MNDESGDALLRQLAQRAREREVAELEREGVEDVDPRLRAANRPLDAEAQARIVEHLRSVIADEHHAIPRTEGAESSSRPRRRTWRRWLALPLAAVLTVAFSALIYRSVMDPGTIPVSDELPRYSLRIDGAVQQQRGGVGRIDRLDQIVHLALGNRLRIVLTPDRASTRDIAARAFVSSDDEAWRAVSPNVLAISEQGAVRLDAILGAELAISTGAGRLMLILGDPSSLPSPEDVASGEAGPVERDPVERDPVAPDPVGPDRWQAFLIALDVGGPP